MKVLITGAAGFIGSNFTHFLSKERPNWNLHALDVLTYSGNFSNISTLVENNSVAFHKIDICAKDQLEKLFSKFNFDLVFHLAAESHVDRSILNAESFVKTNVLGTQILIDLCRKHKVERFVHISTDEVYGSLGPTGKFFEETPLSPSSPYSASKASSDLLVLASHATHNLNCVVTRCTNNYGPYQFPEKAIPLFLSNLLDGKKIPIYGDGLNVRSWLHVDDHSRALLLVAEGGRSGEVYNVGGGDESEKTNIELAKTLLDILGLDDSYISFVGDRPGHDRRYAVDTAKIKRELNWSPKVDFYSGLRETIDWYRQNRSWWEDLKSGDYLDYYERNYTSKVSHL
jgi:dTDP-glucose 4,6-dehydratase